MSKPLFGQILDPDLCPTHRDAVHIPIISVIAMNELRPGDRLTLRATVVEGVVFAYRYNDESRESCYAILDPFIKTFVPEGSLVYAWLRPESTYKLWHEWTHRELDKEIK